MPIVTDYTALLSGSYWNGIEVTGRQVFVTYSFPTAPPATHAADGLPPGAFTAFDATQQQQARDALKEWGDASGITFIEVEPGAGQIRFAGYDFTGTPYDGAGGISFYPFGAWDGYTFPFFYDDAPFENGGDVFMNTAFGGTFAYETILHEIGHALGLKHPTEIVTNFATDPDTVHDHVLAADDPLLTIMATVGGGTGHLTALDMAAAAHIYGAAGSDGTQVSFSNFDVPTQTLTQIGLAGDDTIRGVDVADLIDADAGNDQVFGLGGNDTLVGGEGDDSLFGGSGNDSIDAGAGNDFVLGHEGNDIVLPGFGPGTFDGGVGRDLVSFAGLSPSDGFGTDEGVEITLLFSAATTPSFEIDSFLYNFEDATGSNNGDLIFGDDFDNDLVGWYGADTILGGEGADVIIGYNALIDRSSGLGIGSSGAMDTSADSLDGDAGDDLIAGGDGNDTIDGGGDNDQLIGDDGDDSIDGGFGDDLLWGGQLFDQSTSTGNDTLNGGEGFDVLRGGAGNDSLTGGSEQDTFFRDIDTDAAQADIITDFSIADGDLIALDSYGPASWGALQRIVGSDGVNFRLQSLWNGQTQTLTTEGVSLADINAVNVFLSTPNFVFDTSATQRNVTGTANADHVFGGLGDDSLVGGGGNDTIYGDSGADTMVGEGGNDTYFVDSLLDVVSETAGSGSDTVITDTSYALATGSHIELLRTFGSATTYAVDLTGNELANTIVGNSATNIIVGGGGNDVMWGYGGDDTYYVDSAGDSVTELAGGGSDRIITTVSYTLGATTSVEFLSVQDQSGTAAINLTGNGFGNTLEGNNGANVLDGRGGDDTMVGFGGDDRYFVDNIGDIVAEAVGGGNDTVISSTSLVLAIDSEVELLRTYGSATTQVIDFTGSDTANAIVGNTAGNTIDGRGGADSIWAYGGNDTLAGGSGADAFVFNTALDAANNVDTITDFSVGTDRIWMDDLVFTALSTGTLSAAAFTIDTQATDSAHRIVYDSATGALSYDADGNGLGAQVQFATLSAGLTTLTNASFQVF